MKPTEPIRWHLSVQILIVAGQVGFFCSFIGWLLWTAYRGGVHERIVPPFVSFLLFLILVVTARTFLVLLLEGHANEGPSAKLKIVQLNPTPIVARTADLKPFLVASPLDRARHSARADTGTPIPPEEVK